MSYYIGVDLGGTSIKVGVVNNSFHVIAKASCPTRKAAGADAIISDILVLIDSALNQANLSRNDIQWIGIGCPGSVDQETGLVDYAPNISLLHEPIKQKLEALTGKTIYIDNDANCAALGEYHAGAGKGYNSVIAVTLGTGIGGGFILNSKIYRGFNYAAGEIGHMVIDTDGILCECGRHGCFEKYGSATGLIRMSKEAMKENKNSLMWKIAENSLDRVDGKTSFEAMKNGDKTAEAVVGKYIQYLAIGITNIINIMQPEIIIICGGISLQGEYLLKPLIEEVKSEVYSRHSKKQTNIVCSQLKMDAGMIGAAALGC